MVDRVRTELVVAALDLALRERHPAAGWSTMRTAVAEDAAVACGGGLRLMLDFVEVFGLPPALSTLRYLSPAAYEPLRQAVGEAARPGAWYTASSYGDRRPAWLSPRWRRGPEPHLSRAEPGSAAAVSA